jgi:asparagine synthase (glutamine-hydrolysing)
VISITGIYGIITKNVLKFDGKLTDEFHNEFSTSYLIDDIKYKNAIFGRHSVKKFENDKMFGTCDHTLIANDGVILNLKDLLNRNQANNIGDLFLKLYNENGWNFVKNLRGNFAGFLYNSEQNNLIIFTDHIASKPLYYFFDKGTNTLIFSSELKIIVKGMNELGFASHLDTKGAYCLLTCGYMLKDLTLVEEIKKLPAGHVIEYKDGEISFNEYYKLSSKPCIVDKEEDIIKELDNRFKEAIKLEYEKDKEYGYKHIATLSGGLDSRTNVAYAKKLGYSDIDCFTFSQSNYLDEMIAKKIASENHFEFLFCSLDNGNYLLKNIDNIVSSNDGLIVYGGASHAYNTLKKMSFQEYGLIHTGQIGDLVLGSYLQKKEQTLVNDRTPNKTYYSTTLVDRLEKIMNINYSDYENEELFAFYEKCVNGVSNGYRMYEQFTEFSSPFLYIDFLDYAMRIHPEYRFKQSIYIKWINKYVPEFSNYKWEKYGLPPKYPLFALVLYRNVKFVIKKLTRLNKKHSSMNPMDYWWDTNVVLKEEIANIFKENINVLEKHHELFTDCIYLFNKGTLMEKMQVITLLKAMKMLGVTVV